MHRTDVTSDKKGHTCIYVCDPAPLKDEKFRVLTIVGADVLPYAQDAGSLAANLFETKSDAPKGDRSVCLDIKNHFMETPMSTSERMKVQIKCAPTGIRIKHNIENLVIACG